MKTTITRRCHTILLSLAVLLAFLGCPSPSAPSAVKASTPVIQAQPVDTEALIGDSAFLSVTAISPDGGALSFQWKAATSLSDNAGTPLAGKTGSSLDLPTDTPGVYYYFCSITNSRSSSSTVAKSRTATVYVTAAGVSLAHDRATDFYRFITLESAYTSGDCETLTLNVQANGSHTGITASITGTSAAAFNIETAPAQSATDTSVSVSVKTVTGLSSGIYQAELNVSSAEFPQGTSITLEQIINDGAKLPGPAAPAAPQVSGKNGTSITLIPVSGAEYSSDGTNWQPGPVLENLTASTTYTIRQRIKETATHDPSTASTLSVTTPATRATDLNGEAAGKGWATQTWPLGANSSGQFAVYSKNAELVRLEIYNAASGSSFLASFSMEKGIDNIWRAELSNLPATVYYGYRVWGPNWPVNEQWLPGNSGAGFIADVDSSGNRFNPNKLLFDPYAREISHDKSNPTVLTGHNAGMFGTGSATYDSVPRRNFDTGAWAPKAIIVSDSTATGVKPALEQKDAIIYEAHVRGLTKHGSAASLATILSGFDGFTGIVDIPAGYQGTYRGAGMMAQYLKGLGINTIELLPVHETDNDANPDNSAGGNFWGYMTYGYFAPDRRYSSDQSAGGPTREFKEMVAAFHAAGIEVYLDVVYNHSGEGGNWDASTTVAELTFMRGLDNSEYYALVPANKANYWETTGCGNNLRCDNPVVRQLILDSLSYWIDEMGVDGFRFDLAPVLGRVFDGTNWTFSASAKTVTDIRDLGTTTNTKMIAEAWDIGTYQVGNFPSGWAEWNGRYRDTTRNIMKGTINGSYGNMFYGDYDNFNDQGGPHKSVNFITAHDGFTLADLVSYPAKTNSSTTPSWPFGPSDGGSDNNDSWDSTGMTATTGLTDQQFRRQRLRNMLTWHVFARGVPMLVYGDEFGRTQNGNNNPYNIDSVATWNNYNMIDTDSPQAVATGGAGAYTDKLGTDSAADTKNNLFLFTQFVLKLRAAEPALRQANYAMTIGYASPTGGAINTSTDTRARMHLDGSAVGGSDYLFCMNMSDDTTSFTVPAAASGKRWVRVIDTAHWAEDDSGALSNNCWSDSTAATISGSYSVTKRSILVLKEIDL